MSPRVHLQGIPRVPSLHHTHSNTLCSLGVRYVYNLLLRARVPLTHLMHLNAISGSVLEQMKHDLRRSCSISHVSGGCFIEDEGGKMDEDGRGYVWICQDGLGSAWSPRCFEASQWSLLRWQLVTGPSPHQTWRRFRGLLFDLCFSCRALIQEMYKPSRTTNNKPMIKPNHQTRCHLYRIYA